MYKNGDKVYHKFIEEEGIYIGEDPNNIQWCWVLFEKNKMKQVSFSCLKNIPIVEYRYARATDYDKEPCEPSLAKSTTYWSISKAKSDNVKATFTDGILTNIEILK